jgi:hypothetical protein
MPRTTPNMNDPRVGLKAGLFDAGEAIWNLRLLSTTPPPREFLGKSPTPTWRSPATT